MLAWTRYLKFDISNLIRSAIFLELEYTRLDKHIAYPTDLILELKMCSPGQDDPYPTELILDLKM